MDKERQMVITRVGNGWTIEAKYGSSYARTYVFVEMEKFLEYIEFQMSLEEEEDDG